MNDESQIDPILYREDSDTQQVQVTAIPERAMMVEAASLSLLEKSDQAALDKYNGIRGIPRNEQNFWIMQEADKKRKEYEDFIRTGLLSTLSDPNIPFTDKEKVVNTSQQGSFAPPDSQAILYQHGLVAPSKGESDTGSRVRESVAMQAFKAAEMLEERQQIVNAAVGKREGTITRVADFLSFLVPLESGITAAKMASRTGDNVAKASILPGSYMQDLSQKFKALPFSEQNAYLKELAQIASESSGLTTSKNQLRMESILSNIQEGVSTPEMLFENLVNILDIVGVTASVKGAVKTAKSATNSASVLIDRTRANMTQNANEWFEKTGRDVRMDAPVVTGDSKISPAFRDTAPETVSNLEAEVVSLKDTASYALTRDELEQTRSNLQLIQNQKPKLNSSANPAELRSYLDQKAAYEEAVSGLQNKLANHKAAEDAAEKLPNVLADLEAIRNKEILTPIPKNPVAAAIDRAYNQSTVFTHNPRTPGFILNLTNPEKARALQAQLVLNESEEVANAIHGVGRNEALVKAVAPQLTDTTGRVKRIVDDPEAAVRSLMASELGSAIKNTRDGFRYTETELASARANVVTNYKEVTGLQINDAMSSFEFTGDSIKISGVYTNGQGGWSTPEDALSQAKFALRNRGVLESEIQIMRLDGDEMVPVKLEEVAGQEGVYAVRLEREDRISDLDVTEWSTLDVKRNWLDRLQTKGDAPSWSRYVFEPNSMLHKRLTGSMSVSDDKSTIITKQLLTRFEDFTNEYVKLPANIKKDVDEYIREANVHEIAFDPLALSNRFPQNVVDMLRTWRDAWDTVYVLENSEVVKTLNAQQYQLFKHPNIEAIIKERPKRYDNNRAYDPSLDQVVSLSRAEIDTLYAKQGYIGEFRRPLELNGTVADFIIVRNTPTEHARMLRDSDRVLNYRDGYYQVSYKTPKFIDEEYVDTNGIKRTRTIGVAGSVKEAKEAVERLKTQGNGFTYRYRGDERDISRNADAYWDLNQSTGRIAQRHRGKLLENTIGFRTFGADDFIENPADSAVRAASSMGGRIGMFDTITTAKERWLNQFGHLLSGPDFQKTFPASRDQIVKRGEESTKELADARTTWEYINYMESGYINGMSEVAKRALNTIADAFGEKGFTGAEKVARSLSEANIQGGIKGGVFAAYLATNPLRQWIVQTNQGARLVGYSGARAPQAFSLAISGMGPKMTAREKGFWEFWNTTGFVEAVHRSNLVRGTLLDAANRQNLASKSYDKVVQAGRRYGYDLGETANNLLATAAVYDRYYASGKDVYDPLIRAEMQAEARALNRNMSYAGDMPYNQNALAVPFTYMQVPHKFAVQWADRTLSRADRAKLISADLALWGVPGTSILQEVAGMDILPENGNVRELLVDGLQSWMVNQALREVYADDKAGIDFSSLAPYDMDSWSKMINGIMFDGGLSSLITNSPAGRVFGLSADSRLGYALQTTAMFFKNMDEEAFNQVSITEVADAWARMTSGYTNLQEAKIMYQLGKVVDKKGRVVDDETNTVEAVAKLFGFGTKSQKEYYETIIKAGAIEKDWKESAKKDAELVMTMIRGLNDGDVQGARAVAMVTQTLADASNFPSKQAQATYLSNLHTETMKPAWLKVQEKLANIAGYPDPSQGYADLVKMAPLTQEEKAMYQEAMTKNYQRWKELEEANKKD